MFSFQRPDRIASSTQTAPTITVSGTEEFIAATTGGIASSATRTIDCRGDPVEHGDRAGDQDGDDGRARKLFQAPQSRLRPDQFTLAGHALILGRPAHNGC